MVKRHYEQTNESTMITEKNLLLSLFESGLLSNLYAHLKVPYNAGKETLFLYFSLVFTLYNAKQPLQGMRLQEREDRDERRMGKLIRKKNELEKMNEGLFIKL